MKILKSWTNKKSGITGVVIIAVVLLWPAVPLRGLDVWIQTLFDLFPTNILYPIMAFLTGSYASLYMHNRQAKTCKPNPAATSASFAGVLLGACPACIPAIAFFLPLSVTVALSYLSWVFLLVSILVLLFAIYKMEGFKK